MKRLLLVTLSNIGDVVMTTPVICVLRELYPDARMTVVAGPRAADLLKPSLWIDDFVIYDKHAPLSEQWRFLKRLRQHSYEAAVDLRNTAVPFLVRARRRSPLLRKFQSISRRECHLEVLKMMGYAWTNIPPFDFFHPEEEKTAFDKVRGFSKTLASKWIVVAPVAASQTKTWKITGYAEVLKRILEERDETILIVGDGRERSLAEPLTRLDPARVLNLAGETTLREVCALVSRASLLLTNDSALMHIGYELQRPVAAVFGPTHHEKYGHTGPRFKIIREPVFCSPCELAQCRFKRQACFEDLQPGRVFQACQELLHESIPQSQ